MEKRSNGEKQGYKYDVFLKRGIQLVAPQENEIALNLQLMPFFV